MNKHYLSSQTGDHAKDDAGATPFKTLAKATTELRPGDRVVGAPGIYRETHALV